MATIRKFGEVARVLVMWGALIGIPVVLANGPVDKWPQLNTMLLLFIIWVLMLKKDAA